MTSRSLRVGVVMDPLAGIKPAKDSTLAMMLAAQARGWSLVYLELNGLSMRDGQALGRGHAVTVRDNPTHWFTLGEAWQGPLADLDVLLMRKDPPFDMEYVHATYVLQRAESAGALVVNSPAALRDINEKVATAWFPQCTPATLITRRHAEIRAFLGEHDRIVLKPLDGMGGRSVFVVRADDPNRNVIMETLTENESRFVMAQRYLPEIVDGDKRVLLIEGRPVDFMLARVPGGGDHRGNLVAGARGEGRPLGERERWIASEVGPELARKGVIFAGLDVIGEHLTEINVTSPTGIRELDRQFGLDIAGELMAAIARRRQAG
jgi:glutathione synthase